MEWKEGKRRREKYECEEGRKEERSERKERKDAVEGRKEGRRGGRNQMKRNLLVKIAKDWYW
jgi:hypothetical protein